jgi:hypothetical protein
MAVGCQNQQQLVNVRVKLVVSRTCLAVIGLSIYSTCHWFSDVTIMQPPFQASSQRDTSRVFTLNLGLFVFELLFCVMSLA